MTRIPEGWHRLERLSPFNALVGPLYERRDGDAVSIGLAIEAKHTNSRGVCHGGVLAEWIESKVEIQHVGTRLAFANCYLVSGAKPIVRASAIFARDGRSDQSTE